MTGEVEAHYIDDAESGNIEYIRTCVTESVLSADWSESIRDAFFDVISSDTLMWREE